jgi:hypothetical protein
MTPIHVAGEMAVWSEDKWAAFEGELQSQLRAERRRLDRLAAKRQRPQSTLVQSASWALFTAAVLFVLFY